MAPRTYRVAAADIPDGSTRYIRAYAVVALLAFGWGGFVIWNAREVTYETRLYTAWLLGALVIGAVLGGYWIAFRDGRRRQKLSVEYILDQGTLRARRPGWPDVFMEKDEITKIFEHPRIGLRVLAGTGVIVDIPPEVADFEELKAELVQDRAVLPHPGSAVPLLAVLTSLTLMGVLLAIFFSRNPRAAMLLTIVFVAGHGYSVYRMWAGFRRAHEATRKRILWLLVSGYGMSVSCVLWIVWNKLADR